MKPRFSEQFPDGHLGTDSLILEDGDIITAGGLMAWMDLGLRIIDTFLDPPARDASTRFCLVDPGGHEQRWRPYKSGPPPRRL